MFSLLEYQEHEAVTASSDVNSGKYSLLNTVELIATNAKTKQNRLV